MAQFHFDPATYPAMIRGDVERYDELQEETVRATGSVAPGGAILELGTGTGETARRVLDRHPGSRLVGIDASEAMLAVARQSLPEADLRVQRLEEPSPGGPFELVFSALAVHHLDGAGKRDLFRRVAAALAPRGRFVLADVTVPPDPAQARIPLSEGYDRPGHARRPTRLAGRRGPRGAGDLGRRRPRRDRSRSLARGRVMRLARSESLSRRRERAG